MAARRMIRTISGPHCSDDSRLGLQVIQGFARCSLGDLMMVVRSVVIVASVVRVTGVDGSMWSARQDTIGMRRNSSSVNRCICCRYVRDTRNTSPYGVLHYSDAERVIRAIHRLVMLGAAHKYASFLERHRQQQQTSRLCVFVFFRVPIRSGQPGATGVEHPLPSRVRVTIYNPGARTRSCIKARIASQGWVLWLVLQNRLWPSMKLLIKHRNDPPKLSSPPR